VPVIGERCPNQGFQAEEGYAHARMGRIDSSFIPVHMAKLTQNLLAVWATVGNTKKCREAEQKRQDAEDHEVLHGAMTGYPHRDFDDAHGRRGKTQ